MIFAIVGPTATGKTELGLRIAPALDAEILVCDSMTVYAGMDVGTAKPSPQQRARIPHHLLDIADPTAEFTVARYQHLARDALADIQARGKIPLIAGGSGLYFRAVVDDLEFPPTNAGVRSRLEEADLPDLQARLERDDPAAASFVNIDNKRRVVRALEVLEITGKPFSSFRVSWDTHKPARVAAVDVPQDLLERRIRDRLRDQLERGILAEAARLVETGMSRTARGAIPYPDAIDLLRGKIDEQTFIERGTRANKALARRQRSWFKADPRARWFDATDLDRAEAEIRAYFLQEGR